MVLIDVLNKTIAGRGNIFFFALRAKSCPPLGKNPVYAPAVNAQ